MTDQVDVKIGGDGSGGERAWKQVDGAIKEHNQTLAKTTNEAREAERAQKKLEAAAKKTFESTRTPLENYKERFRDLGKQFRSGAIDQDTFVRAAKQAKQELQQQDPALRKAAEEHRKLEAAARQTFESTRTPLENHRARLKNLGEQLKAGVIDQEAYDRAFDKSTQELREQDPVLRKITEENKRLERAARKTWESQRTPLQKHNAMLRDYQRMLDKGFISQKVFNRAVAEQNRNFHGGSSAAARAAGNVLKFVGAAAGIGSVVGAVTLAANQIRREWENFKREQGQAGQTQITVAAAQKAAFENVDLSEFKGGKEGLKKRVGDLAVGVTGGEATIYDALSRASSFKGQTLTGEHALEAIEVARERFPADPEALNSEVQAILAQKKKTPEQSARDIEGFFIASKQNSPVVENAMFASNAAPAIAQAQDFGNTPRESSALFSTLGQGIGESEGRVSGTAMINMMKRLEEALPNVEGGTFAKLAYLESDAGKRKRQELLGPFSEEANNAKSAGMVAEAKAFTTVMGLLREGQTDQKRLLQANLAKTPEIKGASVKVDEISDLLKSEAIQQNAALDRLFKTTAGTARLENIIGGRGGITREGFKEVLASAGLSQTGQDFALAKYEIASKGGTEAPIEQVINQLRQEARDQVRATEYVSAGVGAAPVEVPRTVSAEEKQTAEGLRKAAARLAKIDEFVASNKELAQAMRENTKATREAAQRQGSQPVNVNVTVDGRDVNTKPNTSPPKRPASSARGRQAP